MVAAQNESVTAPHQVSWLLPTLRKKEIIGLGANVGIVMQSHRTGRVCEALVVHNGKFPIRFPGGYGGQRLRLMIGLYDCVGSGMEGRSGRVGRGRIMVARAMQSLQLPGRYRHRSSLLVVTKRLRRS